MGWKIPAGPEMGTTVPFWGPPLTFYFQHYFQFIFHYFHNNHQSVNIYASMEQGRVEKLVTQKKKVPFPGNLF